MVKFMSGLSAVVAEEGQEATFQCVVSPSDAAVRWFRDGALLQPSEKFLISQSGASHSLTILGLTLDDPGQITAEAEGVSSAAALRVRGTWEGLPGGLVRKPLSDANLCPAGSGDLEGHWALLAKERRLRWDPGARYLL